MPFNFWPQRLRRAVAAQDQAGCSASVADEIVRAETIDRVTLWTTLRIRACLRLDATSPRARVRRAS